MNLGRGNTLIAGFQTVAQLRSRQNIDSVLRLFVADYQTIVDTAQAAIQANHALFRLGEASRTIDLRVIQPPATTFRFTAMGTAPILVKTQQDTLQIVWSATPKPTYDFSLYLIVNKLSDIDESLRSGGLNQTLQTAIAAVRQYKGHDLTDPKMSFTMIQDERANPTFINPGLGRGDFLNLNPNIGVGLIKNQWVPSLGMDVTFVPGRQSSIGYTVGYTSHFFFDRSALDGSFRAFRNDFVGIGISFYKPANQNRGVIESRQVSSVQIGFPVYRRGDFFEANAIRLSATVRATGAIKVQPEIYMNGFFKQVFPGLRLSVGF